jgi:hypothetical protein
MKNFDTLTMKASESNLTRLLRILFAGHKVNWIARLIQLRDPLRSLMNTFIWLRFLIYPALRLIVTIPRGPQGKWQHC